MNGENNFGKWLKHRRRQLDLTQKQLADCSACSLITIRKFEIGERRPSRQLAELLAGCLNIPVDEQDAFVSFARGLHPTYNSDLIATVQRSSLSLPCSPLPLPIPSTPFVGRNEELAQLAARLVEPACRLLTLVGPGGIGKTRLALAAAAAEGHKFPDGVAFVSLTAITDTVHLPQAIAHSLGITLAGGADAVGQLARILQDKRMLLVLDNFEQLLDGAAMLSEWLHRAPHTKWMVTSRERLNLIEEWLLPVQGFVQLDPGMALFTESARRVQPDFSLEGQEMTVARICQYVGGMPLAIELAAGWTAILSCEQILAQMQETFDFLSTSLRNIPQRHRSLRHLFEQTWTLLPQAEQKVLMNSSVFRGGFALDTALDVAGASLPLLQALSNKSLIITDGKGRYDLHELTRHYAAEKLEQSGEKMAVHQQHFQKFLEIAETFEEKRGGPDAIVWYQRLEDDHDNFRAALRWMIQTGQSELTLRMVDCLWWFWFRRGYWQEAEHWVSTALERTEPGDSIERCRNLLYLSTIIALQGRYGEAVPYLMDGAAMARRLEDPETVAFASIVLGQAMPDADQSVATFLEAASLLETVDSKQQPRALAFVYNLLGERLHENGRYSEAKNYYEKSLALYRQAGNIDLVTYPLGNLGRLALRDGRIMEAHDLIGESIRLSRSIGNRHGVADWLIPFAKVNLYEGDASFAETNLREALVLHREMNNRRGQAEALTGLALVALDGGNVSAAQYVEESLSVYKEIRQQTQQSDAALSTTAETLVPDLVDCLFIVGLASTAQQQYKRAAVIFNTANRLGQQIKHKPDAPLQQKIQIAETAVRQNLSDSVYKAAHTAGLNWALDEIFH